MGKALSEIMDKDPKISITIKLAGQGPNPSDKPEMSAWLEWLRNAPSEAKEVEIRPLGKGMNEDFSSESTDESIALEQDAMNVMRQYSESEVDQPPPLVRTLPRIIKSALYTKREWINMTSRPGGSMEVIPMGLDTASGNDSNPLPWEPALMSLPRAAASEYGASHRRGPWSQGDDSYLKKLVPTQGALNWARIAQLIGSRSPKQCRKRYHQNLSPLLNCEPIRPEEGLDIERLVTVMGKRWAEIARKHPRRSESAVRSW